MSEVNIFGNKTVKKNRISGTNQIFQSKNTLKKTERGTFNLCCAWSFFLTSWNDNFECQVLSNFCQVEPIESCPPGTAMKETFLFVKILSVNFGAIWRLHGSVQFSHMGTNHVQLKT